MEHKQIKNIFTFASLAFYLILAFFSNFQNVNAHDTRRYLADKVKNLPGLSQEQLNSMSQHYSGYFNIENSKYYHYVFVESMNDPANDPVILWLNGGPGCSSLMGQLQEIGPFLIDKCKSKTNCTLKTNPQTWAKKANLIFLESPVGTGFSTVEDDDEYVTNTDRSTASDNFKVLKKFFERYNHLRSNDFYIVGESYAGIYVPMLVNETYEYNLVAPEEEKINLKAFAVGNGIHNQESNQNSLMFFLNYHGMISTKDWSKMLQLCCQEGLETMNACNFYSSISVECSSFAYQVYEQTFYNGANPYSIYESCVGEDINIKNKKCQLGKLKNDQTTRLLLSIDHMRNKALMKKRLQNVNNVNQSNLFNIHKYSEPKLYSICKNKDGKLEKPTLYSGSSENIPCVSVTDPEIYFDIPAVREALNINPHIYHSDRKQTVCTVNPHYDYGYQIDSVMDLYEKLIKHYRILIYNGDTDTVCNFLSSRFDFESTFGLKFHKKYSPQHVDGQQAGYFEQFDNLTLLTVAGSGHMVPEDKARPAYNMISNFINNRDYDNSDISA